MSFHNIEAQWGTTEGSTKVEFKFQRNPMTDEGTGVSLPDCHDYNKTTVYKLMISWNPLSIVSAKSLLLFILIDFLVVEASKNIANVC